MPEIKKAKMKPVFRAGALTSAIQRANITEINKDVRQLRDGITLTGRVTARIAGIHAINGERKGVLEPGGDYELTGRGFGGETGAVFLRAPELGTINLRVDFWSDTKIYVGMPDDISGVPDVESVLLVVGPPGKTAFESKRFGFRAAREEVQLRPDKSELTRFSDMRAIVPGAPAVDIAKKPKLSHDDDYLYVRRYSQSDDECRFDPGEDWLTSDIALNPGFEIVGYLYYFVTPIRGKHDGWECSFRGKYAATWEDGGMRLSFGVQRRHRGHGTANIIGYIFDIESYEYSSEYQIRWIASGPRGLPPR